MKCLVKLSLITFIIAVVCACDEIPEEEQMEPSYRFLVGTYTSDTAHGIGLLEFFPEKNLLQHSIIGSGIDNPSFVITSKNKQLVFAVEETSGEQGGKVKSFEFDQGEGILKLIDQQDTFGDHPCYLTLSPDEKFLIAGNYSGGNLSVFANKNGKLTHVQTIQHEGSSIITSRQSSAHVHSVVFHPNGENLLVGDLGADKIFNYDYRPDYSVPFHPASYPFVDTPAGAGPRHLAVSADGMNVYLVHELSAEVGQYQFDNGKIRYLKSWTLTRPDFAGNIGAAEVRISPDGKFVYVSNRGDANTISVFGIQQDGSLDPVEIVDVGGLSPRNFIITSDGKYLISGNQLSNQIVVFERNVKNGTLKPTPLNVEVHQPVYFWSLD